MMGMYLVRSVNGRATAYRGFITNHYEHLLIYGRDAKAIISAAWVISGKEPLRHKYPLANKGEFHSNNEKYKAVTKLV